MVREFLLNLKIIAKSICVLCGRLFIYCFYSNFIQFLVFSDHSTLCVKIDSTAHCLAVLLLGLPAKSQLSIQPTGPANNAYRPCNTVETLSPKCISWLGLSSPPWLNDLCLVPRAQGHTRKPYPATTVLWQGWVASGGMSLFVM